MVLNIDDPNIERLATEISIMTGETKTEAIRKALSERRERLATRTAGLPRMDRWIRFLEEEVWPTIPKKVLGTRLTKEQEEEILGLGKEGV